jgi:hypothetical protein
MANLTSPQLSSIHSHYESQLSKIVSSMNLRKWIVEKMIGTPVMLGSPAELLVRLEDLHAFIIKPSLEGIPPPPGDTE